MINLYRQILDNIDNGVYFVDSDRKIQYWNNTAELMTGFSAREMIGKSFDEFNIKYEDEKGKAVQLFEYPVSLCFKEGKKISRNFFMMTKNRRRIPIEEIASPLFNNNAMAGVIAIFRDISHSLERIESQLRSRKRDRLIPICGWCKKVKNDDNYWEQVETYLTNEGFGTFTHGICPSCAEKIFTKRVYLESYQNICKAISASISLNEVLNLIVTNVVKVMNVKASSVRLLNKETRQLELVAYYGLSEKYVNKGPVAYDASIDDALAGKAVSVYDIAEHKDSKYYREALEEGIRSILSIPMRFEREVIGVLRMYTAEPVKYTGEDLKFMTAIAEQAAIAIVNAKRFEKAVSNEKEFLRVFEEVSKAVSSTLNVNDVLNLIVRKIPEVMRLKAATIRLLDHTRKKLKLAAAYGVSEKYLKRGPVDMEENVIEALNEKPVAIYDVTTDRRVRYKKEAAEEGIKSMLTLPVIARGKVLGVLRLLTGEHREFSQQEIDFAASLAEQCGIAIENAIMYEKIKEDYINIMRYLDGAVFEKE